MEYSYNDSSDHMLQQGIQLVEGFRTTASGFRNLTAACRSSSRDRSPPKRLRVLDRCHWPANKVSAARWDGRPPSDATRKNLKASWLLIHSLSVINGQRHFGCYAGRVRH